MADPVTAVVVGGTLYGASQARSARKQQQRAATQAREAAQARVERQQERAQAAVQQEQQAEERADTRRRRQLRAGSQEAESLFSALGGQQAQTSGRSTLG